MLVRVPFGMIVVPVSHDFVHFAAVDAAGLPLSFLDEMAEEDGPWRKAHMVDVTVQRLVHSKDELRHASISRGYPANLSVARIRPSRMPGSL